MNHSEQVNEIAAALAKAQAGIVQPAKTRTAMIKSDKASYGYKYADLNGIIEAYRQPFSDNGLSVIQSAMTEPDIVIITTMLLHSSGQWFRSSLTMPVPERRPQALGSAITFGRRYALSAMVGVAPDEDDDATTAEGKIPARAETKPAPRQMPKVLDAEQVPFKGPAARMMGPPKADGFNPENRAHSDWFIKEMRKRNIVDERWDAIGGLLKGLPSSELDNVLKGTAP
jgi:hypothetical protein